MENKSFNNKFKGKSNETYECATCKKPFKSRWGSYKYCSIICRRKGKQHLLKERFIKLSENFPEKDIDKISKYYLLRIRFTILRRDKFKCQYCGESAKDGAKLHVDHIIPKKLGGNDNENNLITACNVCNLGKGDTLLTNEEIIALQLI